MPSNSSSSTPSTRTTRANSQADLTLENIKVIIEQAKAETVSALGNEIAALKDELKVHIEALTVRVDRLEKENSKLKYDYEILKSSLDSPRNNEEICLQMINEVEQRQNRQCNVIITGLPESQTGSVDERKEHDVELCSEIFECIEQRNVVFEDTRRLGKQRSDNKRPICVRLTSKESRNKILRNAKKLKQSSQFPNCYINPDLTELQRKMEFQLRRELKRLREAGNDVIIYRGNIVNKSTKKVFHQ